jgi:RNA polymerase sigma-70 factor, ECF subfamily
MRERLDPTLAAAFVALPEKGRRVVELVDIEGLTYRETAETLGIPEGTVMSRLHRARRRMRAHLTDAGYLQGGAR